MCITVATTVSVPLVVGAPRGTAFMPPIKEDGMSGLASAAAADLSLTGTNYTLVIVVAAIAVIALVMGAFFRRQVLAADPGTEKMQEIGAAVEEGAQAYLARQFKTLGIFVVLVFGLLLLLPADTAGVRWGRSGFFVVGVSGKMRM